MSTPEVPGYEVQDRLGAGGMGEVYRARCRPDGKVVAIKIEGSKASQDPRARFHERFLREARILRDLRHENLPQFYAVGEVPDGRVFIAMELLIGRTLSEFVGQDLETLIPLFLQCARALKVTSEAGIVHRDVSPDNFFVVEVGGRSVVKLIDFGISRDAAAIADGLTRAGTFLGKLKYCSPEQTGLLRGLGPVDWRTDLYSFALTMYAVILHRLPFRGETSQQQFQQRAVELAESVFADIPNERLRRLLVKMLRRSPADRHANFDEVIADLLRVKAEVAEEQANVLEASTRLRERRAPVAEAPAAGHPSPPSAPVAAGPRPTPVQAEADAPAIVPRPRRRTRVSDFVSTQGLLTISGLLVLGSLVLSRLEPGRLGSVFVGAPATTAAWSPVLLLLGMAGSVLVFVRARSNRLAAQRMSPAAAQGKSVPAAPRRKEAPAAARRKEAPAAARIKEVPVAAPSPASGAAVAVEVSGARLVVAGDGPTRAIPLCGDHDGSWPPEILIGRSAPDGPGSVRIASRAVSGQQARLRQQGGTFTVENLSKTNTTRVNGRELSPGEKRLLAVGDRIEMGPVVVSFHVR